MDKVPGKVKLVLLFLALSMLVMFADGLFFNNLNSRPSMAMMHMEAKPVLYPDPAPPSKQDYFSNWLDPLTEESNVDIPLEPEVLEENGQKIKVYRIIMNNVLHEIRPGVKVPMFSFNNKIPGPTLRLTRGEHARVIFLNNGTDPHTIHWHGLNELDSKSDGIPDVNQKWVLPGETYIYEFTADESETKMYHCHVDAPHHMMMGMFGALIIDPKEKENLPFAKADQDHVLLFSEMESRHAHVPLPGEMMSMGPDTNLPWLIPSPKFMMPFTPDLNEFLINGKAFPAVPPLRVKEGEVVRLRLINMGMHTKSIHIHGHKFIVTHKDGYLLPEPIAEDTILIGSGERYDAWFKADNPGVWMIHDHAMDNMANGYEPGGIMKAIIYEGVDTSVYDEFAKSVEKYNELVKHADEKHGMLTPSGKPMEEMMSGMMGH